MTFAPSAPETAVNDITGALRVELADEGIRYLQAALRLRPRFPDAMTYLGLLYRQKSYAYFADVAKWQEAVDTSAGSGGVALGLLAGIFASRLLGQIVYQADPRDPVVVGGAVLTMALLGVAASAIPAARALAVDASKLMREE